MNSFFYNESFLTVSERDSLEEDFLFNPILLKDENEYKKEESKSKCFSPLNNTKSESLNIIDMNNEKPTDFLKHKNIWKKEEEKEENNEKIKSNNNSFLVSKTDYSLPENIKNENFNKKINVQVHKKKKYDINSEKKNKILKNREIKKPSSLQFSHKDMSKGKIFFSITKNENNENIINNQFLGKKINQNNIGDGSHKRKKFVNFELNLDDKCFPFKSGKGIINITSKFNYEMLQERKDSNYFNDMNNISPFSSNDNFDMSYNQDENPNLNLNLNEKKLENCVNEFYLMRFVTKKFVISESGRKISVKDKRKYNGDLIRKKIKSKFHKSLKNIINENLKKAGSKYFFHFLPQCFVGNTSKKLNKNCLEMTYKEILTTDFYSDLSKTMPYYKKELIDKKHFKKNNRTLEYLKNNPEISKKSGFDFIKDMKYETLLNNYFISKEFEESLHQVKEEDEAPEYIQYYICSAKNYVNFYKNYKFEKKNIESNENEDDDDDDDDDDYDDYDEEDD